MRFLHTADWQIGTQFGGFSAEEAVHLTEARFDTVREIARLATQRQVDAVLVAGDVFDQQTVSNTVIRKLFGALDAFAGPWFFLPGNHDAALTESVWKRAQRLNCIPPQARVVLEPGVILVDALALALVCAPLTQRNTYDDTTSFFDHAESPPGYFRVGLAHGSVTGVLPASIDSANPIAADRAARARLDYLALGDWHGVKMIDARTWYSGTPEPDRFRNNQPGCVLDVTLRAPGEPAKVEPFRVGQYTWHDRSATLTVASDLDELKKTLASLTRRDVLKLRIDGAATLTEAEALQHLLEATGAQVRALRADSHALQVLPTADELSTLGAQGGYLAAVVSRLRSLQDDPLASRTATDALMLLAQFQRDARAAG
ncbi:metallophosphoesterase family protein [Paraburkholderia hayleyella]|uniref:metallophosphoesterase family protein n=1 Tax=Paraburkholderia hayleyella TaxID=2152889 RepID=UPI00129172DE|nr:DNA repair exonuclease [Paraburkholderia hayleyella]